MSFSTMSRTLDFYFDLMSPYSYLAATQLPALGTRTGATVRWLPLYLPGLLKATGNSGPTAVAAKAMYVYKDVNDWAQHYGLPEVTLPPTFPFVAASADRCALVADEVGQCAAFTLAMYRRIWHQQQDANDPAVISSACLEVGLDPAATLARAGTDELKAKLRANTAAAVERGAYGVPTFYANDEMFVGNDRLQFVERALVRAGAT